MLYTQYKKLIKNDDIKVVSFDIFETLVFRDVAQPKDIFYKIGKKKYVKKIFSKVKNFMYLRIEAEKKARIENNFKEITLEKIYKYLPLTNNTIVIKRF